MAQTTGFEPVIRIQRIPPFRDGCFNRSHKSAYMAPCTGFEPANRSRSIVFRTTSSPPGHTAYGGPGQNRTADALPFKQPLYLLSYRSMGGCNGNAPFPRRPQRRMLLLHQQPHTGSGRMIRTLICWFRASCLTFGRFRKNVPFGTI